MRSICFILMLTITQLKLSLLCPSSCVVCSEDVIICHKLSNIVDAPGTTKALMLTDGLIDSVDNMVFSDLSNMSVLTLSNNAISTIMENAFQNLMFLRTLSLDHNHISSKSLDSFTFSRLHSLETLQLGNNALKDIDGSWFQNSRSLKTLQLEGNLLTSLNSSTFALSDLRNLETLDLSDNLIMYLGQDSFRGFPRLRSLDLSRNRLQTAPDAFSYLSWLSMLNLDLNRWNCTCELRELASYLNSYIQASDKVLFNGQKMVCVNTDNPSVRTVLELSETNCVPPNKNITVDIVAKINITPRIYIRNVIIAIVFSFVGGVGITLAITAIVYHKLNKKLKLVQEEKETGESRMSSPESTQWNFCEGKDTLSMSHPLYNSNYKSLQPSGREHTHHMGLDTAGNHFTCHKCTSTALALGKQKRDIVLQRANHVSEQRDRADDWPGYRASRQRKGNDRHSVLQQRIKDTSVRRQNERGSGIPNKHYMGSQDTSSHHRGGPISAVKIQQLAISNHFSALQGRAFTPTGQMHNELVTHGNHINHSLLKHQAEDIGPQPIYRTISCLHCHQTYEYRQAASNKQSFPFQNHSGNTLQNGAKKDDAMLYRDILDYNKRSTERCGQSQASGLGFKLASQRSVTFDLAGSEERVFTTPADRQSRIQTSKTSVQKSNQRLAKTTSSTQGHSKTNKTRTQAKRTLKVKLNLNPLRKSRVHPKSYDQEDDQEESGKSSIHAKKVKAKGKKKKNESDLKEKSKKEKTSKKSKDNIEDSMEGNEEKEIETVDQDASTSTTKHAMKEKTSSSKSKHTTKENKDSNSSSKETDDVNNENAHNSGQTESVEQPENNIPIEEETTLTDSLFEIFSSHSEAQSLQSSVPPSFPLTSSFNPPEYNSLMAQSNSSILDATNTLLTDPNIVLPVSTSDESTPPLDTVDQSSSSEHMTSTIPVIQEYVSSAEGSPKRKIRLILPEKNSNRPQTALDKKIR